MRTFLRMVGAFLKAWVECANASRVCFIGRLVKFLRKQELTATESTLIALALSMIVVGFLLPGESTTITDFLFSR